MKYSDIKAGVRELGDGRQFTEAEYNGWMKRVRSKTAMSFQVGGFNGLYFLYKEGTVIDGTTLDDPNRYTMPSDYIDDLNIFLDGRLLIKAHAGARDIAAQAEVGFPVEPNSTTTTAPLWVIVRGNEFEISPAPTEAGQEIKMLYNGMPDIITDDNAEDYFMSRFPDLHIFGMGELMAYKMGQPQMASVYKANYGQELQELQHHNRRHYLKNAKIRFQNWNEYESIRNIVFPQFTYTVGGTSA